MAVWRYDVCHFKFSSVKAEVSFPKGQSRVATASSSVLSSGLWMSVLSTPPLYMSGDGLRRELEVKAD